MAISEILSSSQRPSAEGRTNRAALLLGILAVFAPLLTLGAIGEWVGDGTFLGGVLINLAYVLSLLVATAVLRHRGSSWRDIGLARPASWVKTIILGIVTIAVYIGVGILFQIIMQNLLAPEMAAADRSNYNPMVGNLPLLLLMIGAAWTTIAFGEEMVFRAFLIDTLTRLFPRAKARGLFALLGSSILFGAAHFSWGLAGVIETFIMGLIMGFVYLRTGRNLWVTIIAHGIGNTLMFILVYSGTA